MQAAVVFSARVRQFASNPPERCLRLASRTDFNNKESCMAYDLARNLETSRIEGLLATEDCAASPPNRPDVRKTTTI